MPSMINGRRTLFGGKIVDALFDLTDRVAVVTGAGGGLGTAICEGLAARGADVALVDIDAEPLAASAAGVEREGRRSLMLACDVSDEQTVEDVFAQVEDTFARLDILINLAYTPTFGRPEELSLADWEKALRINLTSYFLCCRRAGRTMIAQGRGGAIMNMCSIGGTSAVGRGNYPYSISKGGIVMMTKELALEWAPYQIRVNAIQPCQFLTPGLRYRLDNPELGAQIREKFLSGIPLNRLGEPAEMVGPVLFLVSDAASMVTGVVLPVDGGNLAMNAGGTKG
jgi:NAD(P)-dependent dehydrogenase (short-subunit alcohol dehydrogenase family)